MCISLRKEYNILDFGARICDSLQTEAIQAAIDACFLAGGGRVVIPCGVFSSGCLRLRSNIELYLRSGAILRGSRDPEDYTAWINDTVEPISDNVDDPSVSRSAYVYSRWNNALIRAVDTHDIAITGEPGSYIDGADCYDAQGEEGYRGPHAINMWRCKNVRFSGYTIIDSANWAHALFQSCNITVQNVSVYAGHDGFDIRTCDHVLIEDSLFASGDDAIAGFDNIDVTVRRCVLDSSCSALRFGGTDVLIEDCRGVSPGSFGHRHALTCEQKAASMPTRSNNSRHDMLNVFLYYCDFRAEIRRSPGNIIIRDCVFDNPNRLFALNFDGKHIWCCNRSLSSIRLENCRFTGLRYPIYIYGDEQEKLTLELKDCYLCAAPDRADEPFALAVNHELVSLENVTIKGYVNPRIIAYTEGKFTSVNSTPVEVAPSELTDIPVANRE